MKHWFFCLSFLAIVELASAYEIPAPAVVYRGRLVSKTTRGTVAFDAGETRDMRFRFYTTESGGSPVCQQDVLKVPVQTDGGFVCRIACEGLAEACTNETLYLGLTLLSSASGAGDMEIIPRRQLTTLPLVTHAASAERLGARPAVTRLQSERFTADDLTADRVRVAGELSVEGSDNEAGVVSVAGLRMKTGERLTLPRGTNLTVRAFENSALQRLEVGTGPFVAGDILATAPSAGVALLCCDGASGEATHRIDGLSVFCEKGDPIRCPITLDGDTLRVWFRPFATR